MTTSETELRGQDLDDDDEPTQPADDDDDEAAEHEHEHETPEPQPEPPPFDEAKLEKELRRHAKAVETILGPGFGDMEVCNTCGTLGFTPVDFVPPPELQVDPDTLPCDACKGHGQRITQSLNPQHATRPCTQCGGTGFELRSAVEARAQAEAYHHPPQSATPNVVWNPQTGQWEQAPPMPPPPPQYPPPATSPYPAG